MSLKTNNYTTFFDSCQLAVTQGNPDMVDDMLKTGTDEGKLTKAQATDIRSKVLPKSYRKTATAAPGPAIEVKATCLDQYGFYSDELFFYPDLLKKGQVKIIPQLNNIMIIINHLYPGICFSIFDRKKYLGDQPVDKKLLIEIECAVDAFLQGGSVKPVDIERAVRAIAEANPFNPLADYFTSLPKVTTKHLDNWIVTIGGAEDRAIYKIMARKWLISAVARAMTPGCEVHSSLIFLGKQGAGKTTFFKMLNPREEYYVGGKVDLSNTQKAAQTFQGKFVIEFGELSCLKQQYIEDVKSYLTDKSDTYVPKFENDPVTVPRMMIFGGSTNDPDILTDPTGNRRFWCVEVADKMNLDLLATIKKELWAEAYQAFLAGEQWWLTPEEEEMLAENNEQFRADDPMRDHLVEQLNLFPDPEFSANKVNEIAKNFDSRVHPRKVASVMRELKWERKKATSGPFKDFFVYVRPGNDTQEEFNQESAWN